MLNECKRSLQSLNPKLKVFVEVVKIFLCFEDLSQCEVRKIKNECKNGKFKRITNYIFQIGRHFKQCKECYQCFRDAYDEVKTLFKEVSDSIISKIRRAQWNRATAVVAKGAVIIGDAAGWILIQGAKFPMLNAGVAEKIDALGRAAEDGAAGARAELQRYIDHFEKAQETFYNVWKRLHELDGEMSDMKAEIDKMLEMLKHMEINTENVDENRTVSYEQFCRLFDTLLKRIREARHELYPPELRFTQIVLVTLVVLIIAFLCKCGRSRL